MKAEHRKLSLQLAFLGMIYANYHLAKLIAALEDLETLLGGLEPVKRVGDDRDDLMLCKKFCRVDQVLM